MSAPERTRRVTPGVIGGRRRASAIAGRLGVALREGRQAAGLSQAEVAARTGLSQPTVSALERGLGADSSIVTWSVLAAAVGGQLAAFLERASGADRPRDFEHLRRQELIMATSLRGGWTPRFEEPLDPERWRSRSIDVVLTRLPEREAVVVEVWDWFDDVGSAARSLDAKVAELRRQLNAERDIESPRWRVEALWVVRGTRRNRLLVEAFQTLFSTRFPGSSQAWLDSLARPTCPMPESAGFVWTDPSARRLIPSHFAGRSAPARNGPTD